MNLFQNKTFDKFQSCSCIYDNKNGFQYSIFFVNVYFIFIFDLFYQQKI